MRYIILAFSLVAMFGVTTVQAGDATRAVVREGVHAAFEEFERQMIYKYFEDHPEYTDHYHRDHASHPGRKPGKKGLPPGIAMKLERGGTLPPGIAKQYLPKGLEKHLPAPPPGYERAVVDNDVVLVDVESGQIADVIADVIVGE